jgi:chromosome segregation ATPase
MTIRQIEESLQKHTEEIGRLEHLRQNLEEDVNDLRKELGLTRPPMAELPQQPTTYRK